MATLAAGSDGVALAMAPASRGLHSSTFQLNVSAVCGIRGARRDCVARVKGVLAGVSGCVGCFLVTDTAQVELRSDECKPLPASLFRLLAFLDDGAAAAGPPSTAAAAAAAWCGQEIYTRGGMTCVSVVRVKREREKRKLCGSDAFCVAKSNRDFKCPDLPSGACWMPSRRRCRYCW